MTKNPSVAKPLLSPFGWLRGAVLLCACAVLHCGTEGPLSAEPPDSPDQQAELALSPSNPQMAQGTAQQFVVRGLYTDGRSRDLTGRVQWSVTDDSGRSAPMPADGYLQIERPGRYLVTAAYHGSTLTTALVVTAATVKSVAISPRTPQVAKGLTQAFTAIATFTDGTTQDATKLATWAVKDVLGTGVATIDTTGMLVAKNVGKATITARYQSHSSSTTMEVTAATLTNLLVSPASPTIANGTNQSFTATGTYSDGTTTDLTSAATWAVTDVTGSGVAAIDGTGVVNGKAVGTALVSADYSLLTGSTTLTVSPAVAVSIAITPSNSSIAKGTTQRFTATATLTDGTVQDVTTMAAWTATDRTGSGVASVDSSGVAKGNAEGSATIACTLRGHTAAALLTVTPAVLSGLAVNPAVATFSQGQYRTLAAIGSYSDGSTQDVSATAIWTTTDLVGTNIASVAAGGKVFGKNVGQATITASAGTYSASAVVTITVPTYTGLTVDPSSTVTIRGFPVQFTALATLPDGTTKDVSALATWKATDFAGTGVATVDSKGLVQPLASGLTNISATFAGFSASGQLFVF